MVTLGYLANTASSIIFPFLSLTASLAGTYPFKIVLPTIESCKPDAGLSSTNFKNLSIKGFVFIHATPPKSLLALS